MRPIGACSTGTRGLIAIMTIGAVHTAGACPRSNEARNVWIFASAFDRVKRHVRGLKFESGVSLNKLAVYVRRATGNAVCVATIAQLIFPGQRRNERSGGINTFDAGKRA